ncbi:MAG: peptidylprolyl isomerase [Chitinophagaceae bacterium]|nr:MAG: peptidylprolyl isomerase [Chitinophagaceae bacterium]
MKKLFLLLFTCISLLVFSQQEVKVKKKDRKRDVELVTTEGTIIRAVAHQRLGEGGPDYTLPAEMVPSLFHKKGALAAARKGDNENPERRSSGSQFYIVHGKTFTDAQMDSVEVARLQGRKISPERREYYKTIGGTPQLDGNYTVFGEVVSGQDVVDKIAAMPVSTGPDVNRPLQDVRILSARLIKRRK